MEGGCPPDCLCNSCLFGLLDALLVAPVSVQRAVLSRALGLEGSSNIAAAPAQPAEGAYVPGRRRSRSHGPPGPSTLGSSHSPINEQRRHSAGSLPSAMGRPRRSPNNDHSPGLDASVPLSSEALSLNEQPILDELEPPPQPQPQVYLYGIHPTLVMDAMRIRDQVPDWLLGYTNYLVPGLNHVIRNLADAGPYRRSGMLEALSMVWVYPLRVKSDVLDTFKKFLAFVENQTGKKLRSLGSDNGVEYVSKAFIDFCAAKGIKRELTAPFNPSQNGVAERLNRTIQEKVRSMLSHAALPHGFWAEAVQTAIHLINRSPSKALGGKVPEEVWSGKPPSYAHLRVFGCEAYVHIRSELRTKLQPKSSKCIFLGYGEDGEMGYRLWYPALRKIIRSNDVIFNENCMHKQPTKVEEVRRVVFREDVTYGQPRRPNVQQPLHAENGAENQPIGAENQPQEVAIDAPQVGEQVDGHR
ncbi:hypothetical protein L7F22_002836 [Adiantum nelumboides]|nr:hypothetical protein [Adiantum nelumboides]